MYGVFLFVAAYDTMSAVTISEKKVKQFKERRLSIDSREQAQYNETESAVFKFCRFSLFLKDLFFSRLFEPQHVVSNNVAF